MEPRAIARRLIRLAAEAEWVEIEVAPFPLAEAEEKLLAQANEVPQRYLAPAERMLRELEEALSGGLPPSDDAGAGQPDQDRWTFGTAMILRGAPREIHRGFLQPLRRVPILTGVTQRVAHYLITIDEGEDYLENETHSGVGWHYHYLDWRKQRSNVVLCWDTRWTAPNPQTKPPARRGLFVEKHAEKGKPFRAQPWKWGTKKRETMYEVCSADLGGRTIGEYRCASNKADLVYPPGATLTPHPSSLPATPAKAAAGIGRATRKGSR